MPYDYYDDGTLKPLMKKEAPTGLKRVFELFLHGTSKDRERDEEFQEEWKRRRIEEAEREAKRQAYNEYLERVDNARRGKRRADLASRIASGKEQLIDRDNFALSSNALASAGMTPPMNEEMARTARFNQEQTLGADPVRAAAATVNAFTPPEPEKPKEPKEREIREYLFNFWEDYKDKYGDEKTAWEALPADAKRKLRFYNLYEPGKDESELEKDLSRELIAERKARGKEYDAIMEKVGHPKRKELEGMSRADYMSQIKEIDIISDPVYNGKFDSLKAKYTPPPTNPVEQIYNNPLPGAPAGNNAAPASGESQAVLEALKQQIAQKESSVASLEEQVRQMWQLLGVQK